jgi:hypothetical protein
MRSIPPTFSRVVVGKEKVGGVFSEKKGKVPKNSLKN